MLVIRVELHSAVTGKVTELARMLLWNDGTGTASRGNYHGAAIKGVTDDHMIVPAMTAKRLMRKGRVENYPRKNRHVWNLVARMLASMGYK